MCGCVVYVHSKLYILRSIPNAISDTPYHMYSGCVLLIAQCDAICRGDCALRVAILHFSKGNMDWRCLSTVAGGESVGLSGRK